MVFTTQSTYDTSMEVARQIREATYVYRALGPCVDHALYRVCEGEVGLDQSMHFLQTYTDTGTAVLVDPYRRLGLKP